MKSSDLNNSGMFPPNLQKVQQKAAKLLLGSNNNNSLFEMSNQNNQKNSLNSTQNFGNSFNKQTQLKKNQDIIDAFDENRQKIATNQGFLNLSQKSKQLQNKMITQQNMFTIKSKRDTLLSPGQRYHSKNMTQAEGFFPLTTKSVGFGNIPGLNQTSFNKTQTAQNTARSNQLKNRSQGGDRVGITGLNIGNRKKHINKFYQESSADTSTHYAQKVSKSFVENEDILMTIGDVPKKKTKKYKGSTFQKLNQSQQYYPPIKNPLSPMSNHFPGKMSIMSPSSTQSQNLKQWQSSELPPFTAANRQGRTKVMQAQPSNRNVFSAEPQGKVEQQAMLTPEQYDTKLKRGFLNPIAENSGQISTHGFHSMKNKYSVVNTPKYRKIGQPSKRSPLSQHNNQDPTKQNSRESSVVDSIQYLSQPEKSKQGQMVQQVSRTPAQLRRFMQKFDDLTQETVLQNVFIKIWKLLLKTQYHQEFQASAAKSNNSFNSLGKFGKQFEELKSKQKQKEIQQDPTKKITFESNSPTIPLNLDIYEQCLPQFKKALGAMFDTDEFVAKTPSYNNEQVFFDRFCYDMVSLLGNNVFKLNVLDIEYVFRTTYLTLSHSFGPCDGGVKLLQLSSIIDSPFSVAAMQELNQKLVFENNDDIHIQVSSRANGLGETTPQTKDQAHGVHSRSPKVRIQSKNNIQVWKVNSQTPTKQGFYHGPNAGSPQNQSPSLQRPSALKKFGSKEERRSKQNVAGDQAFGAVGNRKDSFYLQEEQKIKQQEPNALGTKKSSQKEEMGGDQIPYQSANTQFRATDYKESSVFNTLGENIESPVGRSTQRSPVERNNDSPAIRETQMEQDESKTESVGTQSQVSIAQLVRQQQQAKADKIAQKQQKVSAILERELNAKSFEPMDTTQNICSQAISEEEGSTLTECEPFRGPSRHQHQKSIQKEYHKLQSMKSKKRTNQDPMLNGQFQPQPRATDGSIHQQSLIGNSIDTLENQDHMLPQRRVVPGTKRIEPAQKIGREMQLDILEDFKKYDESVFKSGQQDNVLNDGLADKSLLPTEINLLQSNRIDRKTILLNHMQMFDRATCGIADRDAMAQKQKKLVRKLGQEHVNNLSKPSDIDEQQPSLDQFDQLNQNSQVGSTSGLVQIQKTNQVNQGVGTTKSLTSQQILQTNGSSQVAMDNINNTKVLQSVNSAQYSLNQRVSEVDRRPNQTFNQSQNFKGGMPYQADTSFQDPMMINPLNQVGSQVNIDSNSGRAPSGIYVYIDEQGNIGDVLGEPLSRNLDVGEKKSTLVYQDQPVVNQGTKTKYIVQLNAQNGLHQQQLQNASKLTYDNQNQTVTGTYDTEQINGNDLNLYKTQQKAMNDIQNRNQAMLRGNTQYGQNQDGLVGQSAHKMTSRSAKLSLEDLKQAHQGNSQTQSQDLILMEESNCGEDLIDNDTTNEIPSHQFKGSASPVDERLITEQPKIRIQGPKMISIEYDFKHDNANSIQKSKEDATITTVQGKFASYASQDSGIDRKIEQIPHLESEIKPNIIASNKTNYHLMHKKNKEQRKKAAQNHTNIGTIFSQEVVGPLIQNSATNTSRDQLNQNEEVYIAQSKVGSQVEMEQIDPEHRGEHISAHLPPHSLRQSENRSKILSTVFANSTGSPPQKASIGIQNTSDLVRKGLDPSDLSKRDQMQDLRMHESILRKIASQGQRSTEAIECQIIQAATNTNQSPVRNAAASGHGNSKIQDFSNNNLLNQIVTQGMDTDEQNENLGIKADLLSQTEREEGRQRFIDHSVLPFSIEGENKQQLESPRKGRNNKVSSPEKNQMARTQPIGVSLRAGSHPNRAKADQMNLNSRLMAQQDPKNATQYTNSKEVSYRFPKKERENRIRKISPRMITNVQKTDGLTLGIQSRQLDTKVEKATNFKQSEKFQPAKFIKSNKSSQQHDDCYNEDIQQVKSSASSPQDKQYNARKSPRQVVIPIAKVTSGAAGIVETPFMRSPYGNQQQHPVGSSINSGCSIDGEESRGGGLSSFHIQKTKSITNNNKMRYQIIHKQNSAQRRDQTDGALESIQTSKLLQSTIITGQIGDYDQNSRIPGQDEITEPRERARVTALRQREDTNEGEGTTPMGNPLDMLVSQEGDSSRRSKIKSNENIMLTSDHPGITSGSRFVVEHTHGSHPTEPDAIMDNSNSREREQADAFEKNIHGTFSKKTSVTRRLSQNPSGVDGPGKLVGISSNNPTQLKTNQKFKIFSMENSELDKIHTHRQAMKESQIQQQKAKNIMRRSGYLSSSREISVSKDNSPASKRLNSKLNQNLHNVEDKSRSPANRTHQQLKIKELKIQNPDYVESYQQEGLNSAISPRGFVPLPQKTDSPVNKSKRTQIRALNSKDSINHQTIGEPVLILHGKSPERSQSPVRQSPNQNKTHVVEVTFQQNPHDLLIAGRHATEVQNDTDTFSGPVSDGLYKRAILKSFDSQQSKSPLIGFSATHSDHNPSHSIFGANQVPQSREKPLQQSQNSSDYPYYRNYTEYIQHLQELQENSSTPNQGSDKINSAHRGSPSFLMNPNFTHPGISKAKLNEREPYKGNKQEDLLSSARGKQGPAGKHNPNCARVCCIQNAISSQIELTLKKEQIKKMKEESGQNGLKIIQTTEGSNSITVKKGNATPIAVVSFSDHNLQSWRQSNKQNQKLKY